MQVRGGECVPWVREVQGGERCWQNPEETGARWRSRMTAEAESVKTRWLSWRGSAGRGADILIAASQRTIQHVFAFPSHDQTDGTLIFLLMRHPSIDRNNLNCGNYRPKLCRARCCNHWRERWWKFSKPASAPLCTDTDDDWKKRLMQISKVLHLDCSRKHAEFIVPLQGINLSGI